MTDSDLSEIEARLKRTNPMKLSDLLSDKAVEAAHLAFWSASKQDRDAIRAALRAVWEAAELAQERRSPDAASDAKAESEVLDSSCAGEGKPLDTDCCENCNRPFLKEDNVFTTKTGLVHYPKCPPSPSESAMREALEKIRQELWVDFCLAMNTTQPNEIALRKWEARPVIRIIDAALQTAKERG
jgi:hypothetical protein